MEHVHKYKVMPSSTFGMKKVHAVLECQGVIDKRPCQHSMTRVLSYAECEKKSVGKLGKVDYFWEEKHATPSEISNAG